LKKAWLAAVHLTDRVAARFESANNCVTKEGWRRYFATAWGLFIQFQREYS
jgi:hypothetical protein